MDGVPGHVVLYIGRLLIYFALVIHDLAFGGAGHAPILPSLPRTFTNFGRFFFLFHLDY